ncbi:uncharacterized protein LOC132632349 [Lycium barbarum]|uniref:uncharacterized protein LOC132632349 n=1 Tax=Lycium barbarum TaxID=112863 RepID=UPI00293F3287|nr:uncharacterized protein LOC132632349 [Lycium barbarum]
MSGNPIWILQQKLKNVAKKLSRWSREEIGDINDQVEMWEARMQYLEDQDVIHRSENNRQEVNKGHAEYIYWLSRQESLLKQKAKLKWYEEGDTNSKYFHSVIRDRRRRLGITTIKNNRGNWITCNEKIAKSAIKHYEHLFNMNPRPVDPNILECIPSIINHEDKLSITKCPQEEEIKDAIFDMSGDSAAGPDGFSGHGVEIHWIACAVKMLNQRPLSTSS